MSGEIRSLLEGRTRLTTRMCTPHEEARLTTLMTVHRERLLGVIVRTDRRVTPLAVCKPSLLFRWPQRFGLLLPVRLRLRPRPSYCLIPAIQHRSRYPQLRRRFTASPSLPKRYHGGGVLHRATLQSPVNTPPPLTITSTT